METVKNVNGLLLLHKITILMYLTLLQKNNCGEALTFEYYQEANDYAKKHFLNYHIGLL